MIGTAIGVLAVLLFKNTDDYRILLDKSLEPPAPAPDTTLSNVRASRAILRALIDDGTAQGGRRALRSMCPLKVVDAEVWQAQTNVIGLANGIGPWLLRYEDGERAKATAPDGTTISIEVQQDEGHGATTRARLLVMVELASGEKHLVHAPATELQRTAHVLVRGNGMFRTYRRVDRAGPKTRSITSMYRKLGA